MNLVIMDDIHVVLNVREDLMPQFKMDGTFVADVPAIGKKGLEFKIYYISPLGRFAAQRVAADDFTTALFRRVYHFAVIYPFFHGNHLW